MRIIGILQNFSDHRYMRELACILLINFSQFCIDGKIRITIFFLLTWHKTPCTANVSKCTDTRKTGTQKLDSVAFRSLPLGRQTNNRNPEAKRGRRENAFFLEACRKCTSFSRPFRFSVDTGIINIISCSTCSHEEYCKRSLKDAHADVVK